MNCSGIGSIASFDNLEQVGEGTYGYVYRARDKRNSHIVALKRLIIHKENSGFPLCAVREIKFLKSLNHKNIVRLNDIVTSKGCENLDTVIKPDPAKVAAARGERKEREEIPNRDLQRCGNLYLVFEYMEHDLGGLIDAKYKFNIKEIKCIMKQLLEVLEYLIEKKVMHRDIKSSNILISNHHHLKLADFGLARSRTSSDGREGGVKDMTNNVITMWYKPPELLMGDTRYSYPIDMWSAGCVLAELELGRPLFPGKTEVEQLDLICKVIGNPSEDVWQGVSTLPNFEVLKKMPKYSGSSLRSVYASKISEPVLGLLGRILVADPSRRVSPRGALANILFTTPPLPPVDPADLEPLNLAPGTSLHEYQTKQKRRQKEEEARNAVTQEEANIQIAPEMQQNQSSSSSSTVINGNNNVRGSRIESYSSSGGKIPLGITPDDGNKNSVLGGLVSGWVSQQKQLVPPSFKPPPPAPRSSSGAGQVPPPINPPITYAPRNQPYNQNNSQQHNQQHNQQHSQHNSQQHSHNQQQNQNNNQHHNQNNQHHNQNNQHNYQNNGQNNGQNSQQNSQQHSQQYNQNNHQKNQHQNNQHYQQQKDTHINDRIQPGNHSYQQPHLQNQQPKHHQNFNGQKRPFQN